MPVAADAVKSIFADALALTGADREAYLDAACAGDAPLRAEIDDLMAAHERAGRWLDEVAAATTGPGPTDVHSEPAAPASIAAVLDHIARLGPPAGPGMLGRLDHYDLLHVVSRGGFGTVLRARDTKLDRVVAVKLLAPNLSADAAARRRFAREARAAAAIRDDHVVAIHAVREDGPAPYLVMEFVEGGTLADRLRGGRPLPVRDGLRLGAEIARGLAAAHARGLVHRDVKPANVLLDAATGRARLTDFGLARVAAGAPDALTATGALFGTPGYMSPEQARGQPLDARSDLFSLGVVLYQMTTGELPFRGPDVLSVLTALALDTPPAPAERNALVPPELSALVGRLLARDPAGRPATARAVADELQALAAAPDRPAAPAGHRPGRWRVAVAAAALAALLAVGGQVYRVKTAKGTLEIETDDPNVQVVVRKDGAVVRDSTDKARVREVELGVGDYTIELTDTTSGLKLSTDKFEITRNGRATVKVRWTPPAAEPVVAPAAPAARAALGWVTDVGGRLEVRAGDRAFVLQRGDPLPAEPFTVTTLSLESVRGIDGVVGKKLRGLPAVTGRLNLDSSAVTDDDLKDLAACAGLKDVTHIDLGRTAVTGAGLKHLAAFPRLTTLTLWNVDGHSGGPTGTDLGGLRGLNLTTLGLEYCARVGDDGMAALATLPLVDLDLKGTAVTDTGVRRLAGLTGLTSLQLTGRGISNDSVGTLAGFPKLNRLALINTRLDDAGLTRLTKALPELTALDLSETSVSNAGLKVVATNCPKLESLFLRATAVTDDGLKGLAGLPLKLLSLEGNKDRITDAGLSGLAACKHLTALNVKETAVKKPAVLDLADRLPGSRIQWDGGVVGPK
jgi:eukaryotic-like serine/threonine-protein kinase